MDVRVPFISRCVRHLCITSHQNWIRCRAQRRTDDRAQPGQYRQSALFPITGFILPLTYPAQAYLNLAQQEKTAWTWELDRKQTSSVMLRHLIMDNDQCVLLRSSGNGQVVAI